MPASNNSLFFLPEVNHRLILLFAVRKMSSRISAQIAPIRMLPATTNTTAPVSYTHLREMQMEHSMQSTARL